MPIPKGQTTSTIAAGILAVLSLASGLFSARQYQAEALISESDEFKKQQLYSQALRSADYASRMNPYNGYANYMAGSNQLLVKRYSDASESLKRAEPVMPHLPNLLRLAGQVEYTRNNFTSASVLLNRYFKMDPQPDRTPDYVHYLRSQSLYRAGRNAEASVAFLNAVQWPDYREALYAARTINAVLLNRVPAGVAAFSRLSSAFPGKVPNPTEMLSTAMAISRLDAMIRFYEATKPQTANHAPSLKATAMALSRLGRDSEALRLLQRATAYSSKDPEIWLLLGDICGRLGYADAAKTYYREHLRLLPESPYAADLKKRYNI